MSYLDSLEDNLKNLESREDAAQRDKEDRKKRDSEWAKAQAAAPYADQLRSGPFTQTLLNEATRIGHAQRTKVHIAWMDATLRLEARDRKLELRPTGEGVFAVFFEQNQEVKTEKVDLQGDASKLASSWLAPPDAAPPNSD